MAFADIYSVLGIFSISYLFIHIFRRRSKNGSYWSDTVPGPTGLPIVGNLIDVVKWGYSNDLLMMKWANEYGRIFRFKMGSKSIYVLNDFELITEALHHPEIQGRLRSKVVAKLLGPGSGIATATGKTWMEHRRFIRTCFRKFVAGKKSFEDRIIDEAARLIANISKHNGQPMDASYTFSLASCNIISSLVFGRHLDHDDPRLAEEVAAVLESFNSIGPAALNNTVPQMAYFKTGKRYLQANRIMKKMWDDSIEKHFLRFRKHSQRPCEDIIDEYLENLQPGEEADGPFSASSLIWVVRDLYLAGTETVATTLRWSILLLMTHPGVQKRCQEELTSVVGRERFARITDRVNLPYINATMQEIFRVGDIAPLGVPHMTTSDVNLGGYHIPKESLVISNIHAVMNDPKLWPEPEKFNPARFLDADGNFVKSKKIMPFGAGRRICVGEQMAKMEFFVWLTRLLHQFNILPPEDGSDIPSINEGEVGIARTPLPFRVRFVERND